MRALPVALSIAAVLLCGCRGHYERQGDWTVISVRQVDLTKPNVELARGVEGYAKTRGQRHLWYREAVENALLKVQGGTVLVNVSSHENTKRNTFMIRGDVWGQPPAAPDAPVSVSMPSPISVGSKVMFVAINSNGKRDNPEREQLIPGEVIGLSAEGALVRYTQGRKELIRTLPLHTLTVVP